MSYTNGLDDPTLYFNTKLYTGNGTDATGITGVGFQPDLVWLKGRSVAEHHILTDAVRGGNKQLYSSLNLAEGSDTNRIQSLDSDGFTIGDAGAVNQNSATYVTWNWLAGGTASSNTDGSITSNVSANTTSGFSIVSYTGTGSVATVGHGLGSVPKMIITKSRNNAYNWTSYHASLGNTGRIRLNLTDAAQTGETNWNSTTPTSSVFSLGTNADVNGSGNNVIAYCFAEKKGFSKFGSYTGNGNADGTFVYTGFKPSWILLKQSSASGAGWRIHDNKRGISGNPEDETLYASASNAESTGRDVDFLSNGFKLRTDSGDGNSSGSTYIYMCFAENPFVTSTGIPTTAR